MKPNKMNAECGRVEELLNASLDGEASQSERALVEAHLGICESCRENFAALKATKAMVRNLPRLEAFPTEIWSRVQAEIGKEKVVPLHREISKVAAAAAAFLFFTLSFVTLVGYFAPEPPTPEANVYVGNHAYHLMRQPLADHVSWSFVSEKTSLDVSKSEE